MTTQKIKSQEIGTIGKIIIPKEIENMIDFLHKSIGATEWFSVMFYSLTKGDISTLKDLEFTVDLLYPMDIGNAAYTEFKYEGILMDAYEIKEELITSSTGICHTHHSMGAFFSPTDIDEIAENAKLFNYYISLVVDFKKEYKCKIAFPSTTKTTFEYTIKDSEGKLIKVPQIKEEDNIIVGDLTIEFENAIITPEWLDKRVKELKVKKATPVIKPAVIAGRTYPAMNNVMQPIRSYNDYDFDYGSWYNNTITKLTTPKEFLCALINLDGIDNSVSLEGAVVGIELAITERELDYDTYDTAISNNIEIIHDDLYGNDKMFKSHCNLALQVLENNVQLFADETIYQIIKENLELYAG